MTTTITPTATGHRRHHEIDSAYDCEAYDTGYAVPNFALDYMEAAEKQCAEAHCSTLHCRVSGEGEGVVIHCDPNTSLYFPNVRIPAIKYHISKGHNTVDTKNTDEVADSAGG